MQFTKAEDKTLIQESNARAEDGLQTGSRWDPFYEQVVVPIGSVFVVLLIILGINLISK